MNVGDKVKIKEWAVDEGVVGKYFGKIGTVKAKYERNVTVVYEDGLYLFIDKDRLFAGYSDECTFEKSESVKINYCPMCGRKLEVEG